MPSIPVITTHQKHSPRKILDKELAHFCHFASTLWPLFQFRLCRVFQARVVANMSNCPHPLNNNWQRFIRTISPKCSENQEITRAYITFMHLINTLCK